MAIITISRGSFAGGSAVAKRLSERLEYPSLSREEVMNEAARDYGISEKDLSKSLDGKPSFWQQVPGKRVAYVKCVTAVMLAHARDGNLVYQGNVGHLLLSEISQVLRVRVIADMKYRIRAAMENADLNHDEAIAYIEKVDKDRGRWARLLYGVEWEDPTQYDLILNVGSLSEETVCTSIIQMTEQEEFKATPESQKRLADFSLSCRVWATLAKNPKTRGAGLEITADDGTVTVGGTASSTKGVDMIPEIAETVEGVKNVKCEIGVGTDWYW